MSGTSPGRRSITLMVTDEEYESISGLAHEGGISVSEWARRAVLKTARLPVFYAKRCPFCGGPVIRFGSVRGVFRYRCKACQRTTSAPSDPRGGNNRISHEQEAIITQGIQQGLSLRKIAAAAGVQKKTVEARVRLAERPLCACGKPSSHKGWCDWRISQSPGRQEYLAKVTGTPALNLRTKLGDGPVLMLARLLDAGADPETQARVTMLEEAELEKARAALTTEVRARLLKEMETW